MSVQTLDEIYEGQFGPFTIEQSDRQEVILYRAGLAVAAGSVAIAAVCCLLSPTFSPVVATLCYVLLWAGLGLSLFKIHIYLRLLHRVLQAFWAIGGVASIAIALLYPTPLALTAYQFPLTIFGIGFTFAALTGIFFKEAFCFNRLETKFLAFLVPGLLLGHMSGVLSMAAERGMLVAIAALFTVFAIRKVIQPIPPDIGDKSVFEYLEKERQQAA
ncbi:DUF2301 domain-containing membrane protein [cf. Phormidesmis sp. LEGE 11477]|uniref:DUF2301 domain-containing membrane protein n=1 Tax=cf. Phormidesmis sp. LEGE 11477 TaxID=1828680 RepID=UPI001881AC75|nr:DUF2301 domain-containing membrane protein [cf. Phormidesmis sp. LEGE 11477]MBE9064516.1 DUF2301 domain-containing membrane protein [cf. Phormidesmis sp. LEGE 11477]